LSFIPLMFRIATAPSTCCAVHDGCSRSSSASLLMVGGYAGEKMALVVWRTGAWKLQIVKRSDAAGFEVLPKRWIVERTFAWISRNRRLARDFERYVTTVAAFVHLAMIRIMLRRLASTSS
jgi:transposase